jgi:hypothetical protein
MYTSIMIPPSRQYPGDLLIAATALIHNAKLYTSNINDYKFVRDKFSLQVEDPVTDKEDLNKFLATVRE